LAALFLRAANTLESSARLAEQHADRDRCSGRSRGAEAELAHAARARAAAKRGRVLAAQLR
jgi:hypothetical protein